MKDSPLREKSYKFAIRMIKLYKFMASEHQEFVLSKQILRSGTSIGANIVEAVHAQSNSDFVHKLSIAQKEASETCYWLKLLRDTDYLNDKLADSLINDCEEVQKIPASSSKTVKAKLN